MLTLPRAISSLFLDFLKNGFRKGITLPLPLHHAEQVLQTLFKLFSREETIVVSLPCTLLWVLM